MKLRVLRASTIFALVCILALYSGISHGGVSGSKHDLSVSGTSQFAYDTVQVCVFCHTPHGANPDVRTSAVYNASGYSPGAGQRILLWNKSFAALNGVSLYGSSTLDATISEVRAYSLMCLSCHDGVSALNVLTNYPGDSAGPIGDFSGAGDQFSDIFPDAVFGWGPIIGDRQLSTDTLELGNDHPISFDYPTTDAGLVARTGGYVGDPVVKLFPNPSGSIVSMECSTCHDVHNEGSEAAGTFPFLVMSNDSSNLCRNCHLK